MLTGLLYYPVNTADSHRSSSLGTLQSVPGAEERWEAAVFTGFSCTAYYSIHPQHLDGSPRAFCSQANYRLHGIRVGFYYHWAELTRLGPWQKIDFWDFVFVLLFPALKKMTVKWEIVQQHSLGWRLFQSNFQSFTTSRAAINFDEFQGFGSPFSCLYFADYRSSGISFTKPFTKGS